MRVASQDEGLNIRHSMTNILGKILIPRGIISISGLHKHEKMLIINARDRQSYNEKTKTAHAIIEALIVCILYFVSILIYPKTRLA